MDDHFTNLHPRPPSLKVSNIKERGVKESHLSVYSKIIMYSNAQLYSNPEVLVNNRTAETIKQQQTKHSPQTPDDKGLF